MNEVVADRSIACRPQEDVAEDATEPPEVLVFEVTAVAVAIDLYGDGVRTLLQFLSDVENCRGAAVLTIAYFFAIDPYIKRRVDAIELKEYVSSIPTARYFELTTLRTDGFRCLKLV